MASKSRKRTLAREPLDESQIKRRRRDFNSMSVKGLLSLDQNGPASRVAKRKIINQIPCSEIPLPEISSDDIAKNLCNEINRLCKQKQLHFTVPAVSPKHEMEPKYTELVTKTPLNQILFSSHEKPLFTFKQVQLICKDLIKERENQLQERYESLLITKLTQQYDVFVKFTYDQILRRFEATPSYLS